MARLSDSIRKQVADRANGKCGYSKSPVAFSISGFSIEHILPIAKGGTSALENLALSCQQCNNHKYVATTAVDPVTDKTFPLFHPRAHRWEQHFAWDFQFIHIVGLTGTGREDITREDLIERGVLR